ncbi:MAG: arylamine N-acetyltransferase [Chthoniobacteraceae bacterium]|nr:arylamine N-acetyltransferase [Chthoniobacteraceae bacterium]
MESDSVLDLEAYFARIGYSGGREPTPETLRALHLAHVTHVPFENLDVLLGRPIRLDLASLQAKIVRDRRGGYCFEQNGLFAAVLEKLGFNLTRLAARVRLGSTRIMPRTHMTLLVEAGGESWLADVGFGGWGLLEPIPLIAGRNYQQGMWTSRLEREGAHWVLQCPETGMGSAQSGAQYVFNLEPQLPVDYELPNHYCSTHPDSRFVQTLTAQMASQSARHMLRGREYSIVEPDRTRTETVQSAAEFSRILEESFGLHLPPGSILSWPPGAR